MKENSQWSLTKLIALCRGLKKGLRTLEHGNYAYEQFLDFFILIMFLFYCILFFFVLLLTWYDRLILIFHFFILALLLTLNFISKAPVNSCANSITDNILLLALSAKEEFSISPTRSNDVGGF